MSCYKPLSIKNPLKILNPLLDKVTLTVPCGHCHNCKQEKQLGWFVRCWYQHLGTLDQNGFTYYVTLTYNNDHLPKDAFGQACFSKPDVQKFIKRLRYNLDTYVKGCNFKYFLSSEYGGKTHRPHYHALFFVDKPISKGKFRILVRKSWNNGFVKPGKHNFGIVDSVGAIHYCAKYVVKDLYEDSYFSTLKNKYDSHGLPFDNSMFPFHLQSTNLGLVSLLGSTDYNDLLLGRVKMPDSKLSEKFYKLPMYFDRKIFYNVQFRSKLSNELFVNSQAYKSAGLTSKDVTPVYVLNNDGIDMKLKRYEVYKHKCNEKLEYVLKHGYSDYIVPVINEKFKTNFENGHQLYGYLNKKIPSVLNAVYYQVVYKGYKFCTTCIDVPNHPDFDYKSRLLGHRSLLSGNLPDLSNLEQSQSFYQSQANYDNALDIIDYLYLYYLSATEAKKAQDEIHYINQKTLYLRQNE